MLVKYECVHVCDNVIELYIFYYFIEELFFITILTPTEAADFHKNIHLKLNMNKYLKFTFN